MAKSKPDMRPLTKILTHVNEMTFGADAGTMVNEKIDTPGYGGDFMLASQKERAACLILAARVWPDIVTNVTSLAASCWFNYQIVQGDHEADAAHVAPSDKDALMQGMIELHASSNPQWPLDLDPISPEALVITREMTFGMRGSNAAGINSRKVHCVMTYQIVAVSTDKYADMLLTSQRVS